MPKTIFTVFISLLASIVSAQTVPMTAKDAELPSGAVVKSRPETQTESEWRSSLDINGLWQFFPTHTDRPPEAGWGWIHVPDSWKRNGAVVAAGTAPAWSQFDRRTAGTAWYRTQVMIPADWAGRAAIIHLDRVSTAAEVWINGSKTGEIRWPEGEVDITHAVIPGETATIDLKVKAIASREAVMRPMGDAPGQNEAETAKLETAGLIGKVSVQSRPRGTFIRGVYVQPSVHNQNITLTIELSEQWLQSKGNFTVKADMLDSDGRVEKSFSADVNSASVRKDSSFDVSWPWPAPRIWDIDRPELYTLRLAVKGDRFQDGMTETFGFREFRMKGREFLLNEKPLRLRPIMAHISPYEPSMTPAERIHQFREDGFNIGELWPEDYFEPGKISRDFPWYDVADRMGFPVTGVMPHMGWMGQNVNTPEKMKAFEERAAQSFRRLRNHPSVIMWGTSGNLCGSEFAPSVIGHYARSEAARKLIVPQAVTTSRTYGDTGIQIIKKLDPHRPAFAHNGGNVGDIYAPNVYLNFIPLQEREEWLSSYAADGDMPLMFVEFGTPLIASGMRGRQAFGKAIYTEPLLTEYAAIYLGPEAYRTETSSYRQLIISHFVKDQTYRDTTRAPSGFGQPITMHLPSFEQIQELFIRNTWRSWRTWGLTGGMVPWAWRDMARTDGRLTPVAKVMHSVNGDTLAWIAGSKQAFTEKDHTFLPGSTFQKQIVLLNDGRDTATFRYQWRAVVNHQTIAQGSSKGILNVTETKFIPIDIAVPKELAQKKHDGHILLEAEIGAVRHQDEFAFRIMPAAVAPQTSVALVDTVGHTRKMLDHLGIQYTTWNGTSESKVLLIGRETLSQNGQIPGDVEAFVKAGGRAIIFQQNPEWIRRTTGWRVSRQMSRRAFIVQRDHGIVQGMDDLDLRDWNGSSTLLESHPDYYGSSRDEIDLKLSPRPKYGWRWGNRGAISSGAIEKPHFSRWRPILECEFDLAYTPLMELDYGSGRLYWCQLDLEDHVAQDPAARMLASQLIAHAIEPMSNNAPIHNVEIMGDGNLAQRLHLKEQKSGNHPNNILVYAKNFTPEDSAVLAAHTESGGTLIVLQQSQKQGIFGVQLTHRADFHGSQNIPNWPETRGLSESDLHIRVDRPTWLLTNGIDIGADGLLGKAAIEKGKVLMLQFDPALAAADTQTYLRFTRWRQNRAISQILGNVGAEFTTDIASFPGHFHADTPWYHPDYRDDFTLGDDPARYYNW